MVLKKFYLKCLSHGSYFLADEESREAALIDPQRDIDQYLAILSSEGFKLKYILETHAHADFISGHWDLADRTGAEVVYGAKAKAARPHRKVKDGDELWLGKSVSIRVLETPGHTPESVCFLARDLQDPDSPASLFSGDTLFVGEVGRPDLLGARMPARELAGMLYDTVEHKLKPLPDETRVYPAHGAGSACGRSIGDAEFTTIGEEKARNEALRKTDREDFIHFVTADLPDAPAYFSEDARLNLEGVRPMEEVLGALRALTPEEVDAEAAAGALILDTRPPGAFAEGSIPGSLNISLDGQFAPWVGALLNREMPLVLVAEEGREQEAAMRCARVGYENIRGYLQGGMAAWISRKRPVDRFARIAPDDIATARASDHILLDVRNPAERRLGSIPGSLGIPLGRLPRQLRGLDRSLPVDVYCGSGYRSAMAVSMLRRAGHTAVRDLEGGFAAYRDSGLPVEEVKDA